MNDFDLSKVYGYKGFELGAGAEIDLTDEFANGRLGAKLGKVGTGGGGGEEA